MNVKLVGNADRYPIESNKICYLVGRLIRKVLKQIKSQVKEKRSF